MKREEPLLFSSSILHKWSVAGDFLSSYGWSRLLRVLLPWLLVRRYYFYAEPLHDIVQVPPAEIPIRLDLLTEREFPELVSLRPRYYTRSILEGRLKAGHECVVATRAGAVVHVRWLFKRAVYLPYLRRTLTLAPDEVYSDDAYTPPEYRRQGIYTHVNALIRARLREAGYARLTYACASWQGIAERKAGQAGDYKVGEVAVVQWPRRQRHAWRGAVGETAPGQFTFRT
jgi:hypothetical protein